MLPAANIDELERVARDPDRSTAAIDALYSEAPDDPDRPVVIPGCLPDLPPWFGELLEWWDRGGKPALSRLAALLRAHQTALNVESDGAAWDRVEARWMVSILEAAAVRTDVESVLAVVSVCQALQQRLIDGEPPGPPHWSAAESAAAHLAGAGALVPFDPATGHPARALTPQQAVAARTVARTAALSCEEMRAREAAESLGEGARERVLSLLLAAMEAR
jgi:hypothetical protein